MKNQMFENIKESIHPSDKLMEITLMGIRNYKNTRLFNLRIVTICIVLICLITGGIVYNKIINGTPLILNENSEPDINSQSNKISESIIDPPIQRISCSYAINVDDPREVVGFADYAFVGYVKEKGNVEYHDRATTPEGKIYSRPFTNYSIIVIKNIKGCLELNKSINFKKFGGLSEDKKTIQLFRGDELPEQGKLYIFMVNGKEDEGLTIGSVNSNIPLESEINHKIDAKQNNLGINDDILNSSAIVAKYNEAFKNQIISKYKKPKENSNTKSEINTNS
jgi:hypothetical protein